ncbi:MAG: hypothetical protein FJW30_02520 [Acidobacteria bacterium]|nr:hypothetical protein [Acidobacteriota bacterium]
MQRRMTFGVLVGALAAAGTARAAASDAIREVLEESLKLKKGVTLHLHGQTISIVVTSIGLEYVEGRNQQHSRIVVRISAIDAAAMA